MRNFKQNTLSLSLWAVMAIPVTTPGPDWHPYKYNNIKNNRIQHTQEALEIHVDQSASPLIYPFDRPIVVHGFSLEADLIGSPPKIPKDKQQGEKGFDDFVLRLGFIIKGENRLSFAQRWLAPQWLVDMEALLSNGMGIKEISFMTTCLQKANLGKKRQHSFNKKLKEHCIFHLEKEGPFQLNHNFKKPLTSLGLWISSDGDDTKSRFQLRIKSLNIHHQ